ncbi:MAG: acyl-phosphate glycerol 3-phosphate acyltransferase [Hyphomicrobium sp.]|nr:acyl-phosphate glycerol 3-phosphate acyltransferase [Hyphomicrobium sp.]PPC80510.1 MAG: acyl-phosphate glycerol 3-phosphate acyltransferase [Hyphomicrobium sp.]
MDGLASLQILIDNGYGHWLLYGLAGGFALGSIPFGLILTRTAGLGDIRQIGSGNIGATNVLRTGHKGLATLTLVLDALKGTTAVILFGMLFGQATAMVAGIGAFLGHLFPPWLGFKGGKGVATFIGVLLGLNWMAGLGFCAIWLLVALTTRYSSLSALIASVVVPSGLAVAGRGDIAAVSAVLGALLIWKHAPNIERLRRGEEPKIGAKSTSKA